MDYSRGSQPHDEEEHDDDHGGDHVALVVVHCPQIAAVLDDGCQYNSDVSAEGSAEAEEESVHGDHGEAVGCESCGQAHEDAPPPAELEFVHDEDGEDEVHDDVAVAVVDEHGGEEGVEFGFVVDEGLDIEAPGVHLGGQLQEDRVAAGRVEDVHQDEDEQADPQQQGGDGHQLEVGAYCVFDEGDEGVVGLEDVPGVDEGDFHAHLSVAIIFNIHFTFGIYQFSCPPAIKHK